MKHSILLVEDDPAISEMVRAYLQLEGYEVTHAADGEAALRYFQDSSYELIILDIMLPKLNGLELLTRIRGYSAVPVLILSAKDSDVDKALGLGFGADDYLAKPFSMIELLARVKAAIRRASVYAGSALAPQPVIRIRELEVDIVNIGVTKRGQAVRLTAKEWQILTLLTTNPTKVFTKEQLYRSVWKDDYYGDENVINVHISRLREKIEDNPAEPQYIKTLWGIGYKLGEA